MGGLVVTAVLFFGIRAGARGTPSTMNREYQEATDAYLKVRAFTNFDTAVQQPDNALYRRTTSSPSPVSLPRTSRVPSQSRVPPRPRSKRPFQSKGLVTAFMRERAKTGVSQPYAVVVVLSSTGRREGYSFNIFWSARFLEATTKKRSLVPLFIYLFQRTCTKITFIPFVSDLITPVIFCYCVEHHPPDPTSHPRQGLLCCGKICERYTAVWFTGRPLS